MAHVSRLFNVPRYRVTYAVNYESETRRDFDIERLCYKNLMMVRAALLVVAEGVVSNLIE